MATATGAPITIGDHDNIPLFEGVQEITGTICLVLWRGRYGAKGPGGFRAMGEWSRQPHIGMLVELDEPKGIEVWGTLPRSVERQMIERLYECRENCLNYAELVQAIPIRVRFTAELVRPKRPGSAAAFFQRPRNATLLFET